MAFTTASASAAAATLFHRLPNLKIHKTPFNLQNPPPKFHIKCSSESQSDHQPQTQPNSSDTISAPNPQQEPSKLSIPKTAFPLLEKERESLGVTRPEPDNFEIGWKRTKELPLEQKKGYMIMDFLEKLQGLMDRRVFGSTELLAKTGGIVAERVKEEAEILKIKGEVEERRVVELLRVLKLLEMELEMVRAAKKEETVEERLEQAMVRCRQAILVADSF